MDTAKSDFEIILERCVTKDELREVRQDLRALGLAVHELQIETKVLRQEMFGALAELRQEIQTYRQEIQTYRQEIQTSRQETLALIHSLRADTERSMHALTWKIIGFVMTMNAATIAMVYYISRHG